MRWGQGVQTCCLALSLNDQALHPSVRWAFLRLLQTLIGYCREGGGNEEAAAAPAPCNTTQIVTLFPCFLQDRVEEVQAALEELALEKERLLRRNADLQAELQARTAPTPSAGSACNTCGTPEAQQQLVLRS